MFRFFTSKKNKVAKDKQVASTVKKSQAAGSKSAISAADDNSVGLDLSNCQHIGARDNQEDFFDVSDLNDKKKVDENGVWAVIADGMGGLDIGEKASKVAVKVFMREQEVLETSEPIPKRLKRAAQVANTAVYDCAFNEQGEVDLGTTLVAAVVKDEKLFWVSVGDSRIYLFREGVLKQLNRDHIYKYHLMKDVEKGIITKKEADNHPERAYLTSHMGLPELPEIDQNLEPLLLKAGDRILLCSDGLSNTLSDDEIKLYFSKNDQFKAEEMVKQALIRKNRFQDNITVIILSYGNKSAKNKQ